MAMTLMKASAYVPGEASTPAQVDTFRMSEEELNSLVSSIIGTLDSTIEGFTFASQKYGMVFFRDESGVFKQKMCHALMMHYPQFKNSFWTKFSS